MPTASGYGLGAGRSRLAGVGSVGGLLCIANTANTMRLRSAQHFAWSVGLAALSIWRQTMRRQL